MRAKRLTVASVFLIPCFLTAQQPATAPGALATIGVSPVVIHVADPSGTGVPHAQVRVIPALSPGATIETDAKGELALDLKPGGHAVFVRSAGFKTGIAHIDVAYVAAVHGNPQTAKTPQRFEMVLQIAATGSPTVTPESSRNDLVISAYPYHTPLGYSPADLKALPHISVTIHNSHTNADETYAGVRLADLLVPLGVPLGNELRGEALTHCVVATGSDGYEAVLSLAEIDPSFHPGEILVADTMNGKPLDAHSGPFKLVVTEDKRPARSVRNLTTIELRLLQ